MRKLSIPALLAITPLFATMGCSANKPAQPTSRTGEDTGAAPQTVVASLSCRINGQQTEVSMCFTGSGGAGGGSLKVSSNGAVKQYSSMELEQPATSPDDVLAKIRINTLSGRQGPVWQIPLTSPFQITAQSNEEQDYVLRLVIQVGGQTAFQDETSGFGVLSASSDSVTS